MSDLNIQKGDSNAGWINTNTESNAQKTEQARVLNAQNYQSTIVKSQQDQQAELAWQTNAEAGQPKLAPQSPHASDHTVALAQLFSPQSIQTKGEQILQQLQQWEIPGRSKADIEKYANVKVSDPAVLNLAEKLDLPPGLVLKNLQKEYGYAFESAVNRGVTPDEANQLIFAFYFPEHAEALSPQLKALLAKFKNETAKNLNQKQGLPENWNPPTENSEFAASLNDEFASTFEQLLAKHPELSRDKAASLRTMLYMGTEVPDADSLKQLFNALMQETKGLLQAKYGLPENFPLNLDTQGYNQLLLGAYRGIFQQTLDNFKPALTPDQKAMIQKLIENPKLASSLPPEIQALAEEVQTLSLSQIQDKFGLPKTWVPGAEKLTAPGIDPKLHNLAQKGLAQAKEMYVKVAQLFGLTPFSELQGEGGSTIKELLGSFSEVSSDEGGGKSGEATGSPTTAPSPGKRVALGASTSTAQAASAPPTAGDGKFDINNIPGFGSLAGLLQGTEREVYMDYLKVIGMAIIKIEEMIYKIQGNSTKAAKALSAAKLDMELNSLEKQRRQIEEARAKQSKQVDLGPLNDILEWTTKVMMIAIALALAPATGGLSLAICMAYLIDSTYAKETGQSSLFQKMSGGIDEGVNSITLEAYNLVQPVLAFVRYDTVVGGFVKSGSPGLIANLSILTASSAGNPLLASALLGEGRFVQQFVKMCGGNEMEQEITAVTVQMLIQVVVMITMMVATGGFSAPAMLAPGLATALHVSQRVVMIILKIMFAAFNLIMMSLQVTEKAVAINNNILLAQIAILRAQQEALAEETAGLVAMLKKLIDKLLQILMGTTDWLLDVSTFQQQKYAKVSEITTELSS